MVRWVRRAPPLYVASVAGPTSLYFRARRPRTRNSMHSKRIPAAAALLLTAASASAFAQTEWKPTKPVRWIVPFAAGGAADIVSRILGPKVGEILGTQIVVDNRGGASGIIGAEAGAKAPPDGYIVHLGGLSTHILNAHL